MRKNNRRNALIVALLASTALAPGASAWAADIFWRGTVDNEFGNVANWLNLNDQANNRVPAGDDIARIVDGPTNGVQNAQPTIAAGSGFTTRSVEIGSDSGPVTLIVNGTLGLGSSITTGELAIASKTDSTVGTVTISGPNASIGMAAGALNGVGPALDIASRTGSDGTLEILNGGTGTFTTLCLACGGAAAAGTGTITVDGQGSSLAITSASDQIFIGFPDPSTGAGVGTLNVTGGGRATMAGGSADFIGSGSSLLVDGADGSGNASRLIWNDTLTSHGTITVSNGARAEIGSLLLQTVNTNSTSNLIVSGAARLDQIAGNSTAWTFHQQASVQVSGQGTQLNLNGPLYMQSGDIGEGSQSVEILDGAVVNINSASDNSTLGSGEHRTLSVRNGAVLNLQNTGLEMAHATLDVTDASVSMAGTLTMDGALAGNTLNLFNADFSAGDISMGAAASQNGLGNVINIGGTQGGSAGGVGNFNVLSIGLNDAGTVAGNLVLNHTSNGFTLGSAISGNGTIRQIAGDTILSGNSGSFAGNTLLSGGTLLVNGVLGGAQHSMSVSAGGTLGGSGTIGGTVMVGDGEIAPGNSPGTLTIAGNLNLSSSSILNFELGSPGGTAGVDSDLVNVGGNLTLDGTLNVIDIGGFGAGTYRLFNYDGALIDNVLTFGATPGGFDAGNLTVQTATVNQVNLVVGAINAQFWDGSNMVANGAVDGGSGAWNAANTNWTNVDGTTNSAFDPSKFLIFSGTGGTVSMPPAVQFDVDLGIQFAVDGYILNDGQFSLGNDVAFRVGDGTAAGAGYTATLNVKIDGASSNIRKTDLGTLIFGSQVGADFFDIDAGRVIVNNQLDATQTTVHSGGTLGGNGQVENVTYVNNGGTIAPGNSIGALTLASVEFAAGSILEVELNDGGNVAGVNNDLLETSGAIISGGIIHVTPENGTDTGATYTPGLTYTVVRTVDGRTGEFDSVTDDFAFLDFDDSYDHLNVYITSALAGGSSGSACGALVLTFNQDATCGGVLSIGSGSLYTAVVNLSNAEAPVALDQLSGEAHASTRSALIEDSRFPREAAMDRLRIAFGSVAASEQSQAEKRINDAFAFWGQGFGSWGAWDGNGNAAGLDRSIGGFFLGGDTLFGDNFRLGAFGGYSNSSFKVSDRGSTASAETWHLGAYGGAEFGNLGLRFGGAYAWHDIDTARSVSFTGFSDSLSSAYSASTAQIFGEAGYRFSYGGASFEPFANVAYVHLKTDGYSEFGGAAALMSGDSSSSATFTTIGMRAETTVDLGGMSTRLSGMAGWRHAFGDVTPFATHAFAGGANFTVAGVPVAQNALVLDLGATVNLTQNATLGVSYNGQIGAGFVDMGIKANLGVRF